MANGEAAAFSNVLLVLILIAAILFGAFWIYRQPAEPAGDNGPGVRVELNGGSNNQGTSY